MVRISNNKKLTQGHLHQPDIITSGKEFEVNAKTAVVHHLKIEPEME